ADLRAVMARLSGDDMRLLSYDEVRHRLRAVEGADRVLEDVPLDAIVGSVGRYQDFTREFLPLVDEDSHRWVGVKLAMTGLSGVPPVELYRIGTAYFVKDGNHRVSVARQLGAKTIHAYVTPVHARVTVDRDFDHDELILSSEYAQFLLETRIDELRPHADLRVTAPGKYPQLLEHIQVHRYFMGIDEDRAIDWEEAVVHWYDTVYLPVAAAIADHGLLVKFPTRTEADLYLFLSEHRGRLEKELGYRLGGQQIAEGLVGPAEFESERAADDLLAAVKHGRLVSGSESGLLEEILLLLSGDDGDEDVLAAGLNFAADEGATVFGLWIGRAVAPADQSQKVEEFESACLAVGVSGQLAFARGGALKAVLTRAVYVDLVVAAAEPVRAEDAAADKAAARRHAAWMRSLLNRIPKPLFLVKRSPLRSQGAQGSQGSLRPQRPLLAYDGGARSELALFACAYLCLRNGARPVVLSVSELGRSSRATLARASAYLAKLGVESELVAESGAVADVILRTAAEHGCDLILIGSYKYSRWLERVTGGVTERVVTRSPVPVLIT
ncbi:MAG TPA: universal stress protein, partial [Trueperaceae bacterium]|nr:universal stress protein [Trueperaceae bacterium]